MIFLTVGTELPFNRLVQAVDNWCKTNTQTKVFGQIGSPGSEGYLPQFFEWNKLIPPELYLKKYAEADLIIAHAGMGSIITALVQAKPILIMPRQAALREHRNDHQVATAKRFAEREGIFVAKDETMIGPMLTHWKKQRASLAMKSVGPYADEQLIQTIRDFILKNGKQT